MARRKGTCTTCGKNKLIPYAGKNCSNCYSKKSMELCSACFNMRPVGRRKEGKPLCCYCGAEAARCSVCGKVKRVSSRVGVNPFCYACVRRVKDGFTLEQTKKMSTQEHCDLCGEPCAATNSDHYHNHCSLYNGCPECYRGELCTGCNYRFIPLAEKHPELVSEKVKEYLLRRPFARER